MEDMRIYVASLSDYNNGRLEGKWLDLADYSDASELMEAIQEMLDELTEKYKSVDGEVREEFAVHDYEGIPSTLASEYMGEQDFQQLYDIAEVADERGIPVEVLVERAGDTGSDDYQALADSLIMSVNGNDESDIVYEYEDQIGELGSDFWSNHIYIDDVTERVIYGEDVDRFREDILSENPDIEEAEAERQAEEMADEEAERREDLTTYLEDMGYGDEIPSFVSKDYEGAWKRSLSYDFDVINHDGQMYVFSSNYSLGGTILSGMIGAYIGYKVGRAKPQKKGFETEKRIGRKIKGALTKKKMARGGGVDKFNIGYVDAIGSYGSNDDSWELVTNILEKHNIEVDNSKEWHTKGYAEELYEEINGKTIYTIKFDINDAKNPKELKKQIENLPERIYVFFTNEDEQYAKGGNVNTGRSWHQDRRMHNKSERYEKPLSSRKRQFADGGGVGKRKRLTKAKLMLNIYKPSGDFYMEKRDDGYIVHFTSRDASKNISHLMDKFEVTDYGKGYHGSAYYIREKEIVSKGGGIGFKVLSSKVAKRYEGKSVAPKYQGEYGKTYSKSEAKEVGDKVAGKVYAQQQGRKMAEGGFIVYAENEDGYYRKISEHETFKGAERKQNNLWKTGEFNKMGIVPKSKWESNQYSKYKFAEGGGVDGKMNFYVAEGTIYWSDESGEYQRFFTRNHIKAESKEKAKMIFIRYIENQTRTNEWDWSEDDIFIEPATDSDEVIEFRGYLSEKDFGGLSKDKFSIDRFSKGGGISGLNDLIRG